MADMLDTSGVAADAIPLLRPVGSSTGHDFRVQRMRDVLPGVEQIPEFFSRDALIDTFDGTQFDGENHRRVTPWVQAAYMMSRDNLMRSIDQRVASLTSDVKNGYSNRFDVVIVGSGPHGTAVASYLREKNPNKTTLLIDSNPKLGGQFRAYGPKPAFMMNSRVRKADRRLPALPRTAGSINPLGQYSPLELSDVAVGQYAMNTEMGDVCAINGYLSATWFAVGVKVISITTSVLGSARRTVTIEWVDEFGSERTAQIDAGQVVTALGIGQQSALISNYNEPFPTFETAKAYGKYFDTAGFYSHLATSPMPLRAFGGRNVTVLGGGDSALTCLEALLGTLPAQTYGVAGVGRHMPASITWVGAPRDNAKAIEKCLRSRYKNGIPQALYRPDGILSTDGGIILPEAKKRAESIALVRSGVEVRMNSGSKRYPLWSTQETDIVIDCTNGPIPQPYNDVSWNPNFRVGPAAVPPLPYEVQRVVETLKVKENTASLWATMRTTDSVARTVNSRA